MSTVDKQALKRFKKLKKLLGVYYIMLGCVLPLAFLTLWLRYIGSAALKPVSAVTIIFCAAFLVLHLVILSGYLKCPVCKSAFFQRVLYIPDQCKHCGEDLREYKFYD